MVLGVAVAHSSLFVHYYLITMSSNPNKDSSDKTPAEKQQPQKSGDVTEEGAGAGEEGETTVKKASSVGEVGGGSSSVLPPRTGSGSGSGSGAKTTTPQTGSGSASRAAVVQVGGIGGDQQRQGGSTAVATAARAPPTGTGRAKRKAEIIGPVGVEMVCSVCKRDFGSWKALSGHMRSHPERQWRGIFPPPVEPRFAAAQGLPPPQPQQPMREERVALDVDLNQPQQEEEEDEKEEGGGGREASPPPEPEKDAGGGAFDLNMPPASGDGDE